MAFSLTWLPKVLLDAGLKVAEQPGWKTRGHGDVGTIKGVMCHHTAGPLSRNMPSLGVVTNGRSDLSGPLSQLCLGRDGTYFVVAAGRAFHAGRGEWQGSKTGNTSFIGIEAENTGLTTGPKAEFPWPEVQMDAYRRGVAAILKRIKAKPIMCCGHKEYAFPKGRKPDPTFNMNVFRQQVGDIMDGLVPSPILIPPVGPDDRPAARRQGRPGQADPGESRRSSGWQFRAHDRSRRAAVPARKRPGSGRHRWSPDLGCGRRRLRAHRAAADTLDT